MRSFFFSPSSPSPCGHRIRAAISAIVVATVMGLAATAGAVDLVTQVIWGVDSGETWKFTTSNAVGDLGAGMADPALDDSAWGNTDLRYFATPGSGFASYFRKEFTVEDLYRVEAIEVELQYDDAAILWLNGTEVYRTIRGNLPPAPQPVPADYAVPYGGAENAYIRIPGVNSCEQGCNNVDVPAIPADLLNEGSNVWAVTLWNRAGSSDVSLDHVFRLVIDRDALPPGPIAEPVADQFIQLADVVDLQVVAQPQAGSITWSAVDLPPGLTVNANGRIVGAPTQIGVYDAVVTATDDQGFTEIPIRWDVSNAPPVITNPGPQQTASFSPVNLQVEASDPDGGPLVFAASGLPPGITLDTATGLITGSSSAEDAYTVEVTVTDDENASEMVSFAWQIAEPPITVANPGAQTSIFGQGLTLQLAASDPAGGEVTLLVDGLPDGLTYNPANKQVTGTPSAVGEYSVVIDGEGQSGRSVVSFLWTIPNVVPVLEPIPNQVALENISVVVDADGVDPDGGGVIFSASNLPPGVTIDSASGLMSGEPSAPGVFDVTVVATDDEGEDGSTVFTWDVAAAIASPIVINEFVASNTESLLDEDGDSPDWLELHNVAPVPLSIGDWVIEDNSASWTVPELTIPAGGYLVIFASDKDRNDPNATLHTNFKLSKESDLLRLIDPGGFIIDEFPVEEWEPQFADVSFGRTAGDTIFYLDQTTPGLSNSAAGSNYPPVLRPFTDRLYNVGEPVNEIIDAFDPDMGPLSFGMLPLPPGVSIDITTGDMTGMATTAGVFESDITVFDSDGMSVTQPVRWIFVEAPVGPATLVMNEYNAVAPDRQLIAGVDPQFGLVDGNGGDWYEFVVVGDGLDIRGWSIELWDRDNGDELLENTATLVFADAPELASLPAGTIITISEDVPDDVSLDPESGDWHINLQSNDDDAGAFFTADSQENFNSSRSNQNVVIRNLDGVVQSPAVGETELWDELIGGVGSGEVMSLCIDPTSAQVSPTDDYLDNAEFSSWGSPNQCLFENDPLDPDDDTVFTQDLTALRASAMLVAATVEVDCLADNGVFRISIVNSSGSSTNVTVAVSGLPDRLRTIANGDSDVVAVSGRPDGDYDISVTADGDVVFAATEEVACDPLIRVSCLAGNGRLDIDVVNDTGSLAVFEVQIGQISRSRTLAAGVAVVETVTGRADGIYVITITANGIAVLTDTVVVDCDPNVEVVVAVSCLAGNGRVDTTLTNSTGAPASYQVFVGALSPRVRQIEFGASSLVTVTGRPDGPIEVVVLRDGAEVGRETVTVTCDAPVLDDEVTIVSGCLGGNGRVDVFLLNESAAAVNYAATFGGLSRATTVAAGAVGKLTVTGRPDGPLAVTVERNGVSVASESLTIACD